MIHAYDKMYLEKAQTALGRMFDFAVNELKYKVTDFFNLFILSGVADSFGNGDINLLVGKSGIELAYEVLDKSNVSYKRIKTNCSFQRSIEYWTGWILAYYQWTTSLSFKKISEYIGIEQIQELYYPYHEMDKRQFVDKMNELFIKAKPETNIKSLRLNAELTQSQLSERSGIPLRTIQQYEQRRKNINKAQGEYLVALSKVLGCNVEDLLECNTQ